MYAVLHTYCVFCIVLKSLTVYIKFTFHQSKQIIGYFLIIKTNNCELFQPMSFLYQNNNQSDQFMSVYENAVFVTNESHPFLSKC